MLLAESMEKKFFACCRGFSSWHVPRTALTEKRLSILRRKLSGIRDTDPDSYDRTRQRRRGTAQCWTPSWALVCPVRWNIFK